MSNAKKICIVVVSAAAIVIAAVMFIFVGKNNKEDEKYPKIAYINGDLYYGTDEKCEMVPRIMPSGTIETFIEGEIMPDMFDSANFGSEYGSMEYIFLEDGQLIVHEGEDWYYFEKR